MNILMGCLAPEKWWADQQAKRRIVVLVIVLAFYMWLTVSTTMTPIEAAGLLVMVGLGAGIVIDRVIDGSRPASGEIAALYRLINSTSGRP